MTTPKGPPKLRPSLIVYRPKYSPDAAMRLWLLAESNPTPEQYERERARILEGSQRE